MVPYDQPEAALVRRHRASGCMVMLTGFNRSGYDYPMGQERSSDELIRCIVPRVFNSLDTDT